MSANALQDVAKIEGSLWEAADQLRANSKLTSSEYCMPVLGVIFLRHASNRYRAALLKLPSGTNLGAALVDAMNAIVPRAARDLLLPRLMNGEIAL